MDVKELLIGVLSKAYNIDADGVASLFNEDGTIKPEAEQTVLGWDAERVKNLKTGSQKTAFDDGYKKAQSEVLSKFETEFKAKTGFKSEKKGLDLVLDFANATAQSKGEVTEDVIKKHPLYLTLQEEKERAVQDAIKAGDDNLTKFKTELSKKETFNNVAKKAAELFHGLKPVLSSDPVKAKRQEELFIKELSSFEYEIQDNDRVVILKDGKMYEDGHGNRVTLDKIVKDITNSYFDVHAFDPKQSSNNRQQQQQAASGKQFNFEVPKNATEYAKMVNAATSLEEKQAIKEAFNKANSQP